MAEKKASKTETPSYEAAREELIDVVRRLEAGGTTLEESLALWERGEALATICQDWLDGALVRDPAEVADDERLQVRVAGGRLPVRVDRQAGGEDGAP